MVITWRLSSTPTPGRERKKKLSKNFPQKRGNLPECSPNCCFSWLFSRCNAAIRAVAFWFSDAKATTTTKQKKRAKNNCQKM